MASMPHSCHPSSIPSWAPPDTSQLVSLPYNHVYYVYYVHVRDIQKEERKSKQGQRSNKAKQHVYMCLALLIICVCA